MEKLINSKILRESADLQRQFVSAKPFRHLAIDNFLDKEFCQSLLDSFPAFDEKLAINENGDVGAKAVHEKIFNLGPAWRTLDKLVQGKAFRSLISDITAVPDLKFDPNYFGGGTHENLHGQGLNPHVDFNFHPLTRQHRRLNLILYLSPEWKSAWGGAIQLHRDPYQPPAEDDIVSITPAFNRCVIFETNEYSWHGFRRINLPEQHRNLSRKSFALYYYTDTRPAEELGPEHSTIYAENHLPEEYHAGMEMSAEQLQHVRDLLISRDLHLKRLYENIKQLYTELNDLRGHMASIELPSGGEPDDKDSAEVATLKTRAAGLQMRINEIENSTSWRLTRPVRALKRLISGRD